jgi:4a-hydroxytetrahydrobiopterin dehydratase
MARPPSGASRGRAGTVAITKLGVVELLRDSEIDSRLAELEGWQREGETIVKTFELAHFVGSVKFIDRVVEPAEEMGHHPDLSVSWNKVRVSITTHAAGGLTANDFELAKRIEGVASSQ